MSEDFRTDEVCGTCMYLIYDKKGTCWEYCKGELRSSGKKDNL